MPCCYCTHTKQCPVTFISERLIYEFVRVIYVAKHIRYNKCKPYLVLLLQLYKKCYHIKVDILRIVFYIQKKSSKLLNGKLFPFLRNIQTHLHQIENLLTTKIHLLNIQNSRNVNDTQKENYKVYVLWRGDSIIVLSYKMYSPPHFQLFLLFVLHLKHTVQSSSWSLSFKKRRYHFAAEF